MGFRILWDLCEWNVTQCNQQRHGDSPTDYRDFRMADTSPTEYGEFTDRNRDVGVSIVMEVPQARWMFFFFFHGKSN